MWTGSIIFLYPSWICHAWMLNCTIYAGWIQTDAEIQGQWRKTRKMTLFAYSNKWDSCEWWFSYICTFFKHGKDNIYFIKASISVTIVCYSIKLAQIDTELILVSMVLYTTEKNALRYHTAWLVSRANTLMGSGLVHHWFHSIAKETVQEFLNKPMGARNRVGVCQIPIRHFFSRSRRLLTKIFKSAETVNVKFDEFGDKGQ